MFTITKADNIFFNLQVKKRKQLSQGNVTNKCREKILSNTVFFPLQHIPSENVMLGQLPNYILLRKSHMFQPDDGKIIFTQA